LRWGARWKAGVLAGALIGGPLVAQSDPPGRPAESDPQRARVQRALALLQAGDDGQAEAILREVVRIDPSHGTARLQLGQLSLERGDLAEARRHLEIATRSDPQRLYLAWFLTGRVELLEGNAAAARSAFDRSLEAAPRFVPARLQRAQAAESLGDPWTALADLLEVTRQAPGVPEFERRLAELAHSMGAEELAECALRWAIEQAPGDGSLYALLGDAAGARGDIDGAIEAYRAAIARDHQTTATWLALGRMLLERMEVGAAIEAYGSAIETDPLAAEAIGSFALDSVTTEEAAKWRRLLEKLVAARPESVDSLYALSRLHLREGRPADAEGFLREVVRLRPDHAQAHYALAQSLLRQGRRDEGAAVLREFEALDALEREAWERQNAAHRWRLEAEEALEAQAPEAALQALQEIEALGLARSEDRLLIGEALLESGRGEEALEAFTRGLTHDPYGREALDGVARAATLLGHEETATAARRRLELLSEPCPYRPEAAGRPSPPAPPPRADPVG